MKKHIYTVGTVALAIAMSALPAVAFAENGGDGRGDSDIRTDVQIQTTDSGRVESSGRATSTERGNENVNDEEQNDQDELEIELEDDGDRAVSLDDLKQKIEDRRQELEDEEASTTPKFKDAMKNANEVRLAVHTLLSSKDLLGGIGQQVSEIAKHMNDSVATTTNVEAKIQSRGFLTRLFFGGDSAAADVISQQVAQNQQRIDDLTALLGEANVSSDIRAVLTAQITAIQEAQARLQDLAERERKMWGLFSWRF